MTTAEIASALAPFSIILPEQGLVAIDKYIDLLVAWNQKVSLTTVTNPIEIVSRHFGESIFSGRIADIKHGRLADVGTGAGFPGLPLKIAFPDLEIVLIEPNSKKCAFLAEVVATLDLNGVQIVRKQYSDIGDDGGQFDFICARALGKYKTLAKWAWSRLNQEGRILLSLGLEDSILVSRAKGWAWEPPVRIPESKQRMILVGRKQM